ncbi:hypothetical protein QEN19_000342 [Hanseniaspora menglaensis]
MVNALHIPLEIWIDKIFPLIEASDYISIITTSKTNYNHFTSTTDSSLKEELWNVFHNKDIREINDYMKKTYKDMVSCLAFDVSCEEWNKITRDVVYRELQLQPKIESGDTKKQSALDKVNELKKQLGHFSKTNERKIKSTSLLYDSFFVYLAFEDLAFYPIKYECDLIMKSSAVAIKNKDDFKPSDLKCTIIQIIEYFKIITSVYEQDNLYFRQRMRYVKKSQCLSFYRVIMNYCSPFESIDYLKRTNFTTFAIYLIGFIEKILCLIYDNEFSKTTEILVLKTINGEYTFKLVFKVKFILYELLVNKTGCIVNLMDNVSFESEEYFLNSILLNKFLFNSFAATESTVKQIINFSEPNTEFVEFKNSIDLNCDKKNLYFHYIRYGFYSFNTKETKIVQKKSYKIKVVEKINKSRHQFLQKFLWLVPEEESLKDIIIPLEIGMAEKWNFINKETIQKEYFICEKNVEKDKIDLEPMYGFTHNFNRCDSIKNYVNKFLTYTANI